MIHTFLLQNLNLRTFSRPKILAILKSALRKVNIISASAVLVAKTVLAVLAT